MIYTAMLKTMLRARLGAPPERSAADRPDAPLVLVADGVGGFDLCAAGLKYAAGAAGVALEVRSLRWGHGLGRWHSDLTDVANHRAQAEALAAAVLEASERRPGVPTFLVGKSGGTGVVVRALELLPPEAVESAVLLAPALSPRYDLRAALRAIRRELVAFWSPLDVFVLGVGTRVFGTVDRVRSVSAGLVGFRPPPGGAAEGYEKLKQVRWRFGMARTGYLGGHVGPDLPSFLLRYVVPLLAKPEAGPAPASNPGRLQAGPAAGR